MIIYLNTGSHLVTSKHIQIEYDDKAKVHTYQIHRKFVDNREHHSDLVLCADSSLVTLLIALIQNDLTVKDDDYFVGKYSLPAIYDGRIPLTLTITKDEWGYYSWTATCSLYDTEFKSVADNYVDSSQVALLDGLSAFGCYPDETMNLSYAQA